MQIIPVLDIKGGLVVAAKQGDRRNYQPIQSQLCCSAHPLQALNEIMSFYAFPCVYIADLDAIMNHGNKSQLINTLLMNFPDVDFWVDNACEYSALNQTFPTNYMPVIGSESQHQLPDNSVPEHVLSLDFKDAAPLGPPALFESESLWPEDIIMMTLSRIGSQSGPDFEMLKRYQQHSPEKNFVASGGVRNVDDIHMLSNMGINKVLVSSALHDGRLRLQDIERIQAS